VVYGVAFQQFNWHREPVWVSGTNVQHFKNTPNKGSAMAKFALYAHLKAKPDKHAEVEAFLKSALPLAVKESQTITWYAFAEDEGSYGIFDTFDSESGRQAHLDGPIAKALMEKANELLSEPPKIHRITLLADKH
jgi:quinol monooxygenase YgiN